MPMFQRRHYEAIAEEIAKIKCQCMDGYAMGIIENLIALFKTDNPNFDENRFRIACSGFGY